MGEGEHQVQARPRIAQVVCSPWCRVASEMHCRYEGSCEGAREGARGAVPVSVELKREGRREPPADRKQ